MTKISSLRAPAVRNLCHRDYVEGGAAIPNGHDVCLYVFFRFRFFAFSSLSPLSCQSNLTGRPPRRFTPRGDAKFVTANRFAVIPSSHQFRFSGKTVWQSACTPFFRSAFPPIHHSTVSGRPPRRYAPRGDEKRDLLRGLRMTIIWITGTKLTGGLPFSRQPNPTKKRSRVRLRFLTS